MEDKINFEISSDGKEAVLKTHIKTENGTFKPKGIFKLDITGPYIKKFPAKITYDNDNFENELDDVLKLIKFTIMNSKSMIDEHG